MNGLDNGVAAATVLPILKPYCSESILILAITRLHPKWLPSVSVSLRIVSRGSFPVYEIIPFHDLVFESNKEKRIHDAQVGSEHKRIDIQTNFMSSIDRMERINFNRLA
ncbi:MAG: hypothetical protein RQ741_06385 [Wenzhouxiangellaceae bacterium]|nr:hypothetical protein [Wenzhouxiangellaceae bacterium]